MSRGFSGFSQSDIKKFKAAVSTSPQKNVKPEDQPKKYVTEPSTLLNLSTTKPKRKEKYLRKYKKAEINLSDEQRLSAVDNGARLVQKSSDEETSDSGCAHDEPVAELNTTPPLPCKEPTLEDFENRQKQIEAQNKERRAILTKAIQERTKKTKAEQVKLLEIQQDLNKLDQLLSFDVSIIRDKIDDATVAFDEAQKRYEKAEKEFVEAKLQLFKKMEKKEQLTEYLCTLIEQNELRKSEKLAGLMDQLEMEVQTEDDLHKISAPVLPQLSTMNEMIYNNCTTIKDPNKGSKLITEPADDVVKQESDSDNQNNESVPESAKTEDLLKINTDEEKVP